MEEEGFSRALNLRGCILIIIMFFSVFGLRVLVYLV